METENTTLGLAKKAIETIAEHGECYFSDRDGTEIAVKTDRGDVEIRCFQSTDAGQWRVKVGFRGRKSRKHSEDRLYQYFFGAEAQEIMALIDPHLTKANEERMAIMRNAIEREEVGKEVCIANEKARVANKKYEDFAQRDSDDDDDDDCDY